MKRIMFLHTAICIVLMLAGGKPVRADAVEICVDSGNPPFMYEQNGGAGGLYPDLINAVFRRMNVPVLVRAYPWKRALLLSASGSHGMAGLFKNAEREKIYAYSDPIFSERLMLFVKKGSAFPYRNVSDLNGKTVGLLRGWSVGAEFDRARNLSLFSVEESDSDEATFKKLLRGRIHALIASEYSGRYIINTSNLDDQVEMLPVPVFVDKTYLVFAKGSTHVPLIRKFNAALQLMKKDGSYDAVIRASGCCNMPNDSGL